MKPVVSSPDSKSRISLGKFKNLANMYAIYRDGDNFILKPVEIIESHWLDKPENAHLKAQVFEGLEQAKRGEGKPWSEIKHKYQV